VTIRLSEKGECLHSAEIKLRSLSDRSPCLFQTRCPDDTALIKVPRGKTIFFPEQHAAYVYHLHEGIVGTMVTTISGHEVLSAIIVPPQLIGIAGLVGMYSPRHTLHAGEARAITPVTYCKIRREAVWNLLDDRTIRAQIMDYICGMVFNLCTLKPFPEKTDISKRIHVVLSILARSFGSYESNGKLVLDGITHENIALMTNTTRGTVTRALKRFEQDGFIEVRRRGLIILKPQPLLRSFGM